MIDSKAQNNKAIVLEAFETLFNKRDYAAAERFWSPDYTQHSAHIEPGRDGLLKLIKSTPRTLKYEPGIIVAEGDFVIIHGRFSGIGRPVIATDIIRMKDGVLLEHWDVNTFAFGQTKPHDSSFTVNGAVDRQRSYGGD
ncbi:MAG TPA: nuclear transport factor 2 family protein [Acidobacteriaceae bacterium]